MWVTVGVGATVIFVGWSLLAYRASSEARVAVRGDSLVSVQHPSGAWSFVPAPGRARASVGLLFFPGALVDPIAYAPLARAASEAGFVAHIVEVPRRGAFGGADDPDVWERARARMLEPGGPNRWVLSGHSRGAVIASGFASRPMEGLAGLILIGTSHPRDVDLSALTVPVTKIAGTRDGLASPDEVRANAHLLPTSTNWVWIDGGNHSQFGWYGFQPFDRFATVPAQEQHARMVQAVIATLRRAS